MPMRRRSLLGTMATTAAVVGTANAVTAKQQKGQAQQQAAAQPVAAPSNDLTVQLEQLNDLKNKGILTQEEFDAKKKQLLGI